MSRQTKGRAGWHQATSSTSNTQNHFTRFTPLIKAMIITMVMQGLFPIAPADFHDLVQLIWEARK